MGVGTMAARPSAFPASTMRSIHRRTITACITAQRLLDTDPLSVDFYPPIEMKRIMARIRITEEAIADMANAGAFVKAARAEFHAATHSWVKP